MLRSVVDLVRGRAPARPRAHRKPPRDPPPPPAAAPNESGAPLFVPPGHYYSPIVDVRTLVGPGSDIDHQVSVPGIELDLAAQAAVWADWAPHVERWAQGESSTSRRYRSNNSMFGEASARYLAGAVGALRPRRYIEIGSGFSSAVLLDINDEWRSSDPIELTFIEPHPERLESLLRDGDDQSCTILAKEVQAVDLEVFDRLEPGDVLFIDSTHVAKSGSDVLAEIFTILPRLRVGVFVHLHDIPYPFDYPQRWRVEQNRSWNEAYFLRAFLMYNAQFAVHFWTDFFARFAADLDPDESHALLGQGTSSMWLSRVAV